MPRKPGETQQEYAKRLGFSSVTKLQNHLASVGHKADSTARRKPGGTLREASKAARGQKSAWDKAVQAEKRRLERKSK